MTDDTQQDPPMVPEHLRDCGVMSLENGFYAYERSRDRSRDWPFINLRRAILNECASNGFSSATAYNIGQLLRRHFRKTKGPLEIMRGTFQRELSGGLAEAIGYQLPRKPDDRPVFIPQEVWKYGVLDWDRAQVSGVGFELAHIKVVMPFSSYLVKDGGDEIEPMPLLSKFYPSEVQRKRWGLKAETDGQAVLAVSKTRGRPSYGDDIREAYDEIPDHSVLTNQQLFNEIRERVMRKHKTDDAAGLGDSTIQKHVTRFRRERRDRKN